MNIYEKLQKCRVELQEKNIKKSGENKYSGFQYFELADFVPHINQLFKENSLCSNFSIKEGYAFLKITNIEKPEEIEIFESPIAEVQLKGCTEIQALGAVHTYMKRYLYLNALEIVESDILDKNAGNDKIIKSKKEDKKESIEEYANFEQKNEYRTLVTPEVFAKTMNDNKGKLPLEEYERVKNG